MTTIENILKEVQVRLSQIKDEQDTLLKIEQMYSAQLNLTVLEPTQINEAKSIPPISDYPIEKKVKEKMLFLDEQSSKGWCMISRKKIIEEMEKEKSNKTLMYFSQDLKSLVAQGFYIRCKFNKANRYCYYFKPEWVDKISEGQYKIKPEHMPDDKIFMEIPESKRSFEKTEWYDSSKMQ